MGTEPEQFVHSRYIIAWASNIHGNNVHLWPFIEEARRKGAKLVVIDPYRTRTAKLADWYLPINPGTDAALALGMMHVIISENLFDADYVSRYTVGFEDLKARAQQYPPAKVAHWTGISAADIRQLAREYATVRPSVIRVNYGIQRSDGGGMAMRAVTMLPCLIGSWKELGGGLQLSTSGAFGLNTEALKMPELMQKSLGRPARVVNMVQLGRALNTLTAPPIQALFVYSSNPAAVCPNHNEVVRGLKRPTFSPWSTSSFSPTPPTTPTSCSPPQPFSNTKTYRPPTATTTSKFRTRRWIPSANAAPTSTCPRARRAHGLSTTNASAKPWIP